MPRIFLNYRRDDTKSEARLLYHSLVARFTRQQVMMDINTIPPAVDFKAYLANAVKECDIFLALIGPRWMETGSLNDPEDWVRIEIEAALAQGKKLLPILINQARIPRRELLPISLQPFAYKSALPLDTGCDFDFHVGRIVELIEKVASEKGLDSSTGIAPTFPAQETHEDRCDDVILVRRLTEGDHEDAKDLLMLYTRRFDDDGTNYSPEELLEFITKPILTDRHLPDIENIVLVAKHRSTVVGFMMAHFYPQRRKAIVSYYAIDKRDDLARTRAARHMASELQQFLSAKPCDFLFFDTQNPDPHQTKNENRERRARPALFKLTADSLGLHAYKLHFDYRCPRVSLDSNAREHPFTLLCIPLSRGYFPIPIPRDTVLEFLRFIYEDCYGDTYAASDTRFAQHHKYLTELIETYTATLPEFIPAD